MDRLWLAFEDGKWVKAVKPAPEEKGPHRYGTFKDAFRHRVLFLYGTQGSEEENKWAFDRARFDAETFWYRGNASVDMLPIVQILIGAPIPMLKCPNMVGRIFQRGPDFPEHALGRSARIDGWHEIHHNAYHKGHRQYANHVQGHPYV